MKKLGFFLSLCFYLACQPDMIDAQQAGCTDPNAANYNFLANQNDGSCTYAPSNYVAPIVTNLSATVNESSGIIWWRERVWTHNDSGGDPAIYAIDTLNGNISQTITLQGATNIDWEDIAQDANFIYVNDLGNNSGNRTNLRIFKVAKTDIPLSGNATVVPTVLNIRYPQQTIFNDANTHNFDCEGFIAWRDSIHIFTKNRGNNKTQHYRVPTSFTGIFDAVLLDSFDVNGMVTGADVSPDGKTIALTGYINLATPHLWLFFDFPNGEVFKGNKRRIELGTPAQVGQLEAVCFRTNKEIFMSSEELPGGNPPQRLYRANISQWVDPQLVVLGIQDEKALQAIEVQQDLRSGQINLHFGAYNSNKTLQVLLFNSMGQALRQDTHLVKNSLTYQMNTDQLPIGVYFLQVTDGRTFCKTVKVIK